MGSELLSGSSLAVTLILKGENFLLDLATELNAYYRSLDPSFCSPSV